MQKPVHQRLPVARGEPEGRRVRCEGVSQILGEDVRFTKYTGRKLSDESEILTVVQQVGDDAARTRDEQATSPDPITFGENRAVQPDIAAPGLAPHRKRELVKISRSARQAIDRRGGPAADHTLLDSPIPGRRIGCELKPGCTQFEMLNGRGSA